MTEVIAQPPSLDFSKLLLPQPDDPLLVKFQGALKNFYQAQNAKLDKYLHEMRNDIAAQREANRNALDAIRVAQKNVVNIRTDIADLNNKCIEKTETIGISNNSLHDLTEDYSTHCKNLEAENNILENMSKERDSLGRTLVNLKALEEESLSQTLNVKAMKESTIKNNLDNMALLNVENLYINQIVENVNGLNDKIRYCKEVHDSQQEEKNELKEKLIESEESLEVIRLEKKQLLDTWDVWIKKLAERSNLAIQTGNTAMEKSNGNFLLHSRINQYKYVHIRREQEKGEILDKRYKRLTKDNAHFEHKFTIIEKQKEELVQEINFIIASLMSSTKKSETLIYELWNKKNKMIQLEKEERALTRKRQEIEADIQERIQASVNIEKFSKRMVTLNTTSQDRIRKLELTYFQNENNVARIMRDNETLKEQIKGKTNTLENDLKPVFDQKIAILKELEKEHTNFYPLANKLMNTLIYLAFKVKMKESEAGNVNVGAFERTIENLKTEIKNLTLNISKVLVEWFKLQDFILIKSRRVSNLTNDVHELSKKLHIFHESILRTEELISQKEVEIIKIKIKKENLVKDFSLLNNLFGSEVALNERMKLDFRSLCWNGEAKLKDAQVECIKRQNNATRIKKYNENLAQKTLFFEKKMIFCQIKYEKIREAKLSMIKLLHKNDGTLQKLRVELHKQRYLLDNFKKEQEAIMRLQQAHIDKYANTTLKLDLHRMLGKSDKADVERRKLNLRRRIKSLRDQVRLKKKQQEVSENERMILMERHQDAVASIQSHQRNVLDFRLRVNESSEKRFKNVILLSLKQSALRMLNAMLHKEYTTVSNSKLNLETKITNVLNRLNSVLNITKILREEFPDLELYLLQIGYCAECMNAIEAEGDNKSDF